MCGIAGILGADPERAAAALKAMTDAQAHRGPDDRGQWRSADGRVGLGHRRLAVIDTSAAGHQPMLSPDGRYVLVLNGEIYNFRELREGLEACGHRFLSTCDTEVLLYGLMEHGPRFVERLNGIFAFAFWDNEERQLLLARDPIGVKPLYVFEQGRTVIFASEVRAILRSGLVPRRLDPGGLFSYLTYGSVQEPYTMVSGVRSLAPGHYLVFSLDAEGHLEACDPVRYWRLPQAGKLRHVDDASLLAEIRGRLEDAVRSQLVSDVPLGVFLSGGIDSTAIAALARRASSGPVRTFSVVFPEGRYDERRFSRLAARHIGTDHTEVELTGDEARSMLPRALASFDQPSADGLNTWFVSRAAREAGLTVALSGVGGDELFGGYDGYRKPLLAKRAWSLTSHVPWGIRRAVAAGIGVLDGREQARKLQALLMETKEPYLVTRRFFSERRIRALLCPEVRIPDNWQEEAFGKVLEEVEGYDTVNRVSALELRTYMLSTLLRDTDQMGMAHSLEVRVPLIDPKIVAFMLSLPGSVKLDRRTPKPLLTRPLEGLVPDACIHRPKRGFELPFEVWLRDAMRGEMRDLSCTGGREGGLGLLAPSGLEGLWQAFERRRVNWSRVWAVYVLVRWIEANDLCL